MDTTAQLDTLTIDGIDRAVDGTYEFDFIDLIGNLTNREIHRIKVMTGVRYGEMLDAFKAGDNDLNVAFAAILLQRRGKRVDDDVLWDAPAGSRIHLHIHDRDEEPAGDDVSPPEQPSATE